MKKLMKKNIRYEAQALAVVMIVLVVAVVIGMAMLSRVMRDRERIVDEKSSAEALELSDSLLDTIKGTSVTELETLCSNPQYGEGLMTSTGCQVKGVSQVRQFLTDAGVSTGVLDTFGACTNDGSDISISMGLATEEDDYEIRPDGVRSFVVRQQTPSPAACTLDLEFEPRGGTNAGVSISMVYARNYNAQGAASSIKVYEYDDISQYCLIRSGGSCPDGDTFTDSWIPLQAGDTLSLPLGSKGSHDLDEVRVRAINSVVSVKSSLSSAQCIEDTQMVKIVVAANCSGSYRAKEIQIPQQEWASPIFDYVLFNGNGTLRTE